MGKQSIDGDSGQMRNASLNVKGLQATFAYDVKIDGQTVTVGCEMDGGTETVAFELPGVISTDLRLNEPRLPKLPDIMKAKISYEVISDAELGGVTESPIKVLSMAPPQSDKRGRLFRMLIP